MGRSGSEALPDHQQILKIHHYETNVTCWFRGYPPSPPGYLGQIPDQSITSSLTQRPHAAFSCAAIPANSDCYVFKSILHNWDDDRCATILERCRKAMHKESCVLLVERVRPAKLRPTIHDEALARTDLNMLAGLGGRERSLDEFEALLRPTGLTIRRVHQTGFEFSAIEAGKA